MPGATSECRLHVRCRRGGEITVSPTVFDFGLVSVAGPPASGSVMITNTGSSTMVNGLLMGGCFGFAAGGPFPILLGNGQSVFVSVGFDPTGRGPFNARTSAARASGFPQLVRAGGDLYFAWTEAGRASRIRAARMSLGMARDLD